MSPSKRRRRVAGVVIGTLLAVGAGVTALVVTHSDHAGAHTVAAASTSSTAPPTTATTLPPTTTTTVPLPQPTPAPVDAYADVPIYQIGTITIPKIGLVSPIFEGVWLTVVDHGPGHWPGSAMPGHI
jgi:sortase A